MNPNLLTHIVPALPPQIDGVGDYALNLARQLRDQHGINGRFIVCDPDWSGPSRIDGFVVRRLRLRNEAGIWSLLGAVKENPSVLLHYVGYGYHNRGVPLWLYRGIESWLTDRAGGSDSNQKQFSTVFHETWATSNKPWKSAFYLQPVQRWLVERLHRQSNVSITSTRGMQSQLEMIEPKRTLCLPIPSNVPMADRTKLENRANGRLRVAVFGQHWSRSASIRSHANLLHTLEQKNLLASAVLFGKGLTAGGPVSEDVALLRSSISATRVEVLGELSPEDVSRSLAGADLFISHYRGQWACKSGAFMAALAAGCPAVLRDGTNSAPLCENEHFIASDDSRDSVDRIAEVAANGTLGRIAAAGRLWYERNADWKVIAQKFDEALKNVPRAHPIATFSGARNPDSGARSIPSIDQIVAAPQ